jgi:hypothetical protein
MQQVAVSLGTGDGVGRGVSVGFAAACITTSGVSVAWAGDGHAVGLSVATLGDGDSAGAASPAQPKGDHMVPRINSQTSPPGSLRLGTMRLYVALDLPGVCLAPSCLLLSSLPAGLLESLAVLVLGHLLLAPLFRTFAHRVLLAMMGMDVLRETRRLRRRVVRSHAWAIIPQMLTGTRPAG